MNYNLMLHCGANAVERNELVTVTTPNSTATWYPIPHEKFLGGIEEALPHFGLSVVQEAHALTHDGRRYFGLLQIQNGSQHPDYSWILGIRNSHDKMFPAGIVAGSQVFVCDNLAFSGEVKVARKHTRFILRDLPGLIGDAIGKLVSKWKHQDQRIEAYKNCRLKDRDAHDLVIRALDVGAINTTQIPAVIGGWRKPHHSAFEPRNVWSWFNGVTEVLKGSLMQLPRRTEALHNVCDAFAGLPAA